MGKVYRLMAKAAVPVGIGVLALSLAAPARAASKVQLSGKWNFNLGQSDDADQKVQDAKINSDHSLNETAGGGSYPGGMGGPDTPGMGIPTNGGVYGRGGMGGMGMPPGGGSGRGQRHGTRGAVISDEEWDRLAENPKYLQIEQTSDHITVTTDNGVEQTLYPDGKKHDGKDENGKKYSTKTSWDGDTLVAETKMVRGERLTQSFRLSDDGKQLYVTTRFEDSSMSVPLSIRRVYDMPKAAGK